MKTCAVRSFDMRERERERKRERERATAICVTAMMHPTGSVGRDGAGAGAITLGLAQEVVDGGAEQRPALLLLAHQLWESQAEGGGRIRALHAP